MADITDSTHTNRLIRLLMMLPSPHTEDTFPHFWNKVATDISPDTGVDYVTGKIATHLRMSLSSDNPGLHHERLASYALYFFGQASDALVKNIAVEVNTGAPNDTAGQLWVQELRTTAFAVMEESVSEERVHDSLASWVRFNR